MSEINIPNTPDHQLIAHNELLNERVAQAYDYIKDLFLHAEEYVTYGSRPYNAKGMAEYRSLAVMDDENAYSFLFVWCDFPGKDELSGRESSVSIYYLVKDPTDEETFIHLFKRPYAQITCPETMNNDRFRYDGPQVMTDDQINTAGLLEKERRLNWITDCLRLNKEIVRPAEIGVAPFGLSNDVDNTGNQLTLYQQYLQ